MSKPKRPNTAGMQLPLWELQSAWRPPRVADLPSWDGAKRVGFDVETYDPHLKQLGIGVRRGGYVVGYSFALEDGPRHYVPLRHAGGDNVEDPDQAVRYLRDQAARFAGQVVGAKLDYDLDYALQMGVEFKAAAWLRDVQIADPLIYELHQSYSLEAICGRHGLPGKDESLLQEAARHYGVDPKGGLWQLPARYVGPYGEGDAERPLLVLRRQEREIEEQGLWDVFNLESRLLPVLVRMRRRGVRVSQERLEGVERWSLEQEAQELAAVHHLTGVRVALGDVWKAGALAPALEAVGVRVPVAAVKGKPQYSIDKEFLARVDHPVAAHLARARKVNKLRTTFAASVRTHMIGDRIHCTFNQLRATREDTDDPYGAAYGRLSCENPNMQQQPARGEFAKMWRSIYVPEDGALWFANDYSQQEPRMTVHYAALLRLEKAEEVAQRYRDDPSLDNHRMMAELTGLPRKQAKDMLLGLSYGMGGAKTARNLGLPTRWAVFFKNREKPARYFQRYEDAVDCARQEEGRAWEVAGEEAQAIIDTFNGRLPFVKKLAKKCEAKVKRTGFIRTLGGRRCRFPVASDGGYDWTHKALNRLIQGSSADQTKKAVVDGDAAGHFIQLQVHDEVDGSTESEAKARQLAEIMAAAYPMKLPFKVDVELGPSWGESMKD